MQSGVPPKIAGKALKIPCTTKNFLKVWFDLLRPVHRLTPTEMRVAAAFVEHWYALSKTIKDDEQLNMILFSPKEKQKIYEEVGISYSHMRAAVIKLKQRGIIKNGKLNYSYIPIRQEGSPYRLIFIIDDSESAGTNNK